MGRRPGRRVGHPGPRAKPWMRHRRARAHSTRQCAWDLRFNCLSHVPFAAGTMGKVPVKFREVVYTLSPFEQHIMGSLWKDIPEKAGHYVTKVRRVPVWGLLTALRHLRCSLGYGRRLRVGPGGQTPSATVANAMGPPPPSLPAAGPGRGYLCRPAAVRHRMVRFGWVRRCRQRVRVALARGAGDGAGDGSGSSQRSSVV